MVIHCVSKLNLLDMEGISNVGVLISCTIIPAGLQFLPTDDLFGSV
jgi:hypothetical protein